MCGSHHLQPSSSTLEKDIFIRGDYAFSALEMIFHLMGYTSVLSNSNSNTTNAVSPVHVVSDHVATATDKPTSQNGSWHQVPVLLYSSVNQSINQSA